MRVKLPIKQSTLVRHDGQAYSGEAYSGEAYSGEAYDSIVGRHRLHRRPEACTGAVRKPARGLFVSQFGSLHGLFVSQFGSLHGRGVHVGLEWFDGSRTSDEEERDGLQRGKQLAGIL